MTSGFVLGTAQALGMSQPETISYSLTAGKTYVLMVAGWSGAGGNWEIAAY